MIRVIKWTAVFLILIGLVAVGGVSATRYFTPVKVEIPTVVARRGEFVMTTHTRGALRSVTSTMVTAPNVGGTLMVTTLQTPGAAVKKDETVLAFDPEDLQNSLDDAVSRVDEAEQTIRKNRDDQAIADHTDQVDLMKAEFAVRRAELDVSKNEMVSSIDAEKNVLALEAARKKLAQLREDVRSRTASSTADLAVSQEKLTKAKFDQKQAEDRLKQLNVKASMDGLVSIRQNWNATGGMGFPGMNIPDFRTGDQIFGGAVVMDIVDKTQLEMAAKILETDRGNLKEGQDVVIHLDSLPDLKLTGKVKTLGGINATMWDAEPNKTFDCVFSMSASDSRLRPGQSGEVEITTDRVKDAVYLPAQAVIEKDGKRWAYVWESGKFSRREVATGHHSESQVEITKGLRGGEKVALADPEERAAAAKKKSNPLKSSPGGG